MIPAYKKFFALVGISLGAFVAFMDFTIVSAALPSIQASLKLSLNQLEWVMNAFLLFYCVFMATMGRLADIQGRRKLLSLALCLFGLGCLLAGCANSFTMLVIGRAVQGLGEATLLPASLALIAEIYPESKGKAIGIWSSIAGIGLLLGQGLGGFIVSILSWHWIFLINIPFFIFALFMTLLFVSESYSKTSTSLDTFGFIFLTLAVSSFVIAIIQAPVWHWKSPWIIILFLFAIINFILLFQSSKWHSTPLINFKFFNNKIFLICSMAHFIFVFFNCSTLFLIPLYLHYVHNIKADWVGILMMSAPAMMIICSLWAGTLLDKKGYSWPVILGLLSYAISAALQFFFHEQTSIIYLTVAFMFMGAGWGILLGPTSAAAINAFSEKESGIATGILWTIQVIGGSVGVAVSGVLFQHETRAKMIIALRHAALVLSQKQQHFISLMLNNPVNIKRCPTYFLPNDQFAILQDYMHSFLFGYHRSMALLCVLCLFGIIFSLLLERT